MAENRIEAAFGPLLPKRACGECTVCCTVCAIEELAKPNDTRCVHLSASGGCGIYDERPGSCRAFYCAWRRLSWLGNAMRPDRSGVMLTLEVDPGAANPFERRYIVARWIAGGPDSDRATAEQLRALFRRQSVPCFFSPSGSSVKRLAHPSVRVYEHVLGGTLPGGAADAEVLRWKKALAA